MLFRSEAAEVRLGSHRIADWIYEKLTGEKGVFSTRIAYVTRSGSRHTLRVDDSKGAAALEVGADDGRDRLVGLVLVAEADHRDRQLGRADAGDLDPELRRCRQREQGQQGDAATAARELNLGQ